MNPLFNEDREVQSNLKLSKRTFCARCFANRKSEIRIKMARTSSFSCGVTGPVGLKHTAEIGVYMAKNTKWSNLNGTFQLAAYRPIRAQSSCLIRKFTFGPAIILSSLKRNKLQISDINNQTVSSNVHCNIQSLQLLGLSS